MSAKDQILEILRSGESLTGLEALRRCGTMKLSTRISDLRKEGNDIKGVMVQDGRKHYMRYSMTVVEPSGQ